MCVHRPLPGHRVPLSVFGLEPVNIPIYLPIDSTFTRRYLLLLRRTGSLGIQVLMSSTPGPTTPGPAAGPDVPAGPMPTFDHAPSLLATAWTLLGLASIALGLRVFCKWSSGRRLWWDDGVLIASWVSLEMGCCQPSIPSRLANSPDGLDCLCRRRGHDNILGVAWPRQAAPGP